MGVCYVFDKNNSGICYVLNKNNLGDCYNRDVKCMYTAVIHLFMKKIALESAKNKKI